MNWNPTPTVSLKIVINDKSLKGFFPLFQE